MTSLRKRMSPSWEVSTEMLRSECHSLQSFQVSPQESKQQLKPCKTVCGYNFHVTSPSSLSLDFSQ